MSPWFDKNYVLVEFTVSPSNHLSDRSLQPDPKKPDKDLEIIEVSVQDPQLKEKSKDVAV